MTKNSFKIQDASSFAKAPEDGRFKSESGAEGGHPLRVWAFLRVAEPRSAGKANGDCGRPCRRPALRNGRVYAAPLEPGNSFGAVFYKYAAPMALGGGPESDFRILLALTLTLSPRRGRRERRGGRAEAERRRAKTEPEPSHGSPLLGFARDCSPLLAFCRGIFFAGRISPQSHRGTGNKERH
jgi:hypothetical protein